MGKPTTLQTKLVEYFIDGADPHDVARKLNLDYQYVNSIFSGWRWDKSNVKKELEREKEKANEPVFSILPAYKIFESQHKVPDFCLETNNHEVLLAYHRMINPPKKKAA